MWQCLSCIPWLRQKPARRRTGAAKQVGEAAPDTACGPDPEVDDERPLGCGWFDSSHELERGLLVNEADADTLSTLPLGDWLDLQLATRWPRHPSC
jgi:hypothetical protein